jgi:hypothetical protein
MVARRDKMEPHEPNAAPGSREEMKPRAGGPPQNPPSLRLAAPAGTPPRRGHTTHPSRPALRMATAPVAHASPRPGRIAWWLWVLLMGSLVFFAVARVYVRHQNARLSGPLEAVPFLQTTGPSDPVRAGALDLIWGEVPGATSYRLSVSSTAGQIVVDALPVDGTEWIPPDDALPALVGGEYRWSVEALDEMGTVLAKSAESTFRVI